MSDIGHVVISGSSTCIPFIKQWLKEIFKKLDDDIDKNFDSNRNETGVALGAIYKAIQQQAKMSG